MKYIIYEEYYDEMRIMRAFGDLETAEDFQARYNAIFSYGVSMKSVGDSTELPPAYNHYIVVVPLSGTPTVHRAGTYKHSQKTSTSLYSSITFMQDPAQKYANIIGCKVSLVAKDETDAIQKALVEAGKFWDSRIIVDGKVVKQ